ncbi:unnamed protein product [Parajaminaea phylloscopi]
MDRFDVVQFADLTGPEGGQWVRIGGGSFGVVYQGEYLGTPVAIKEVLPNNTYDVEKYFERECVLMKEARHPNIVQYIGLTKSPGPDGRIYIISEFVGGNVRSYIADTKRDFSWRLRMSFAMDIARALAYLHARNCMHRDLKGENLLITPNDRIKVCDFGFARIAARNEEEMRRISYCGTDGYMSPEILLGIDFSLPSDVFSLGVIFCEIASRHLVDSTTFKREMPSFGLDTDEIRDMASEGCPEGFIQLCIDCVHVEPHMRPVMRDVVRRLRDIEMEVVQREQQRELQRGNTLKSVGSVRGASIAAVTGKASRRNGASSRRPPAGPRLPSFEGQVRLSSHVERRSPSSESSQSSGSAFSADDDDEDLEAALAQLEGIQVGTDPVADAGQSSIKVSGHGNPWWSDCEGSMLPTLPRSWLPSQAENRGVTDTQEPELQDISNQQPGCYPTSVLRASKLQSRPPCSSALLDQAEKGAPVEEASESNITVQGPSLSRLPCAEDKDVPGSFLTASSRFTLRDTGSHAQEPSLAVATMASSIYSPAPLFHRFTLVKNGTRRPPSLTGLKSTGVTPRDEKEMASAMGFSGAFVPPAVMLANALARCHVCTKRIGWKPFLDCDDCPYKCHIGCGDLAEPTCQEMQIPCQDRASAILTSVYAPGIAGSSRDESNRASKESTQASKAGHRDDVHISGQQYQGINASSPALHVLRRAAAAAQASYAAEGGEAPPPPLKDSTLKQRSPTLPPKDEGKGRGAKVQEALSAGAPAPATQVEGSRAKTNNPLKRWSKVSPIRT